MYLDMFYYTQSGWYLHRIRNSETLLCINTYSDVLDTSNKSLQFSADFHYILFCEIDTIFIINIFL